MSLRTERVASLHKEEKNTFVNRENRYYQFGLITVTDVQITPDLRIAKVYLSIMGSHETRETTFRMIENHKGEIRSHIGMHVRLKFTPALQFYIDETMDRVDRINQLIKQIHTDDDKKQ